MPEPRPIDVLHLGRERVICCWQAGDALVDPGPAASLGPVLEALDGEAPRRLLLTHIHLDHAGAAGTLVARFPDLEVHVSERGAPHLADPAKLLASATRLYGDEMERLWGEVLPVPEANLRPLSGGERLDGGVRVEATPGHASHHVAFLLEDEGWAFVGDVAGVRLAEHGPLLPPTPPPDIDLEAWQRSLDVVEGWAPTALGLTHFGAHADVGDHLERMRRALRAWGDLARHAEEEAFQAALRATLASAAPIGLAAAYVQAMPPGQQLAGLRRYWSKRGEGG